ncbi:MAG: guanylate kinase [Oscillospiraceae bacterium]|nr:guanylate kinase [Oscillospiraceae bacterium]
MSKQGTLVVLSGPSGSGKSTVIAAMLKQYGKFLPPVHFSVSATTREPRPGEDDGVAYHFVSREKFDELVKGDGLLEFAAFAGHQYGTPYAPVKQRIELGEVVLLDIEVKGAVQIKQRHPDALFVYLVPPSLDELEDRLRKRGTECEESIAKRMQAVSEQLSELDIYDHIVFNRKGDIDRAAFELASVIMAKLASGREIQK